MIKEVTSAELFVNEKIRIVKNRLEPEGGGAADAPRASIVTGIHGDELEGQFVAFELARRINEHPEYLKGVVDIYPAMNPLGVSTITRGVPLFDLDMNRIFPGNEEESLTEHLAKAIVDDIAGSCIAFDIHASNIFLMEIPQIRINEITAKRLVPLAKKAGVDFVWVHSAATVLESTLAYSLNDIGVDTLVVEMGVGMRISREYGERLCDGIFNLLIEKGIWAGPRPENLRQPIVSTDGKVSFLNANAAGIFIPSAIHENMVEEGEEIGIIVDPASGSVKEHVLSPTKGLLFTLREYPVVTPGSLLGRILGGLGEPGQGQGEEF